MSDTTILIVPGLRDAMPGHWQSQVGWVIRPARLDAHHCLATVA